MGKTYASIHVLNGNMETIEPRLAQCQFKDDREFDISRSELQELKEIKDNLKQVEKLFGLLQKVSSITVSFFA